MLAHRRQVALWGTPRRAFRMAEPLSLDVGRGPVRWERRVAGRGVAACLGVVAPADLALFASRLLLVALHRGAGLGESARMIAALTEAYGAARGRPLGDRSFAWYLATCLVARQVKTSIRHLAPYLEPLCSSLLALAERTLAQGAFDVALLEEAAA